MMVVSLMEVGYVCYRASTHPEDRAVDPTGGAPLGRNGQEEVLDTVTERLVEDLTS